MQSSWLDNCLQWKKEIGEIEGNGPYILKLSIRQESRWAIFNDWKPQKINSVKLGYPLKELCQQLRCQFS